MSQIKVQGNASGTGNFTIQSPNSNNNRTLTLPDETGTVLTNATPGVPINGPAFSVVLAASQSINASVNTKLAFASKIFDTNNNFDATTNYRFTPTVAGYYQFTGCFFMPVANTVRTGALIYKNGIETLSNYGTGNGINGGQCQNVTGLLYANGSTDYFELYAVQTGGGAASTNSASALTYFQGALVRAA
jgi:hypothetical protein